MEETPAQRPLIVRAINMRSAPDGTLTIQPAAICLRKLAFSLAHLVARVTTIAFQIGRR